MLSQIKKFLRLQPAEQLVFVEAYFMLGLMRAAILTISFKKLTRFLKQQRQHANIPLTPEELSSVTCVSAGIKHAANHTPWESTCLVQSLTAQKMLERRGVPGVIYLGVKKESNETERREMEAHAWSQSGDVFVTGGEGSGSYTVISVFAWGKK